MTTLTNRTVKYLDANDVPYTRLNHRRDNTTRQTAHDCRIKPADFAKVVGLETEGRQFLAVLPADHYVDLARVEQNLGVERVTLLPEGCLATFFPDYEVGAFPPMGNLYGLPVYVAPALTRCETIAFNAGTHEDVIQMPYAAFKRLVNPTVMDFAFPAVDFSESVHAHASSNE
jgi:Ala-tRNA(Pro) deacylase